jgi:hypothetical protein
METEEIQKKLQDNQGGHVNNREGEQLEELCTTNAGAQKQNLAPTTEEEMENHQQRDYISKSEEKL